MAALDWSQTWVILGVIGLVVGVLGDELCRTRTPPDKPD